MSFYNTGNPVPSIDPRDLDDNAKHIDEIANSTLPTFVDRLGVTRQTLAGIEAGNSNLAGQLADSSDPSKGVALVGNSIRSVATIAALKLITPRYDGDRASVDHYATVGDGGGGDFRWSAASVVADDGGLVLQATGIITGRWVRIFSGNWVNVSWFGVVASGSDEYTKIQNAHNSPYHVEYNSGTYRVSQPVIVRNGQKARGRKGPPFEDVTMRTICTTTVGGIPFFWQLGLAVFQQIDGFCAEDFFILADKGILIGTPNTAVEMATTTSPIMRCTFRRNHFKPITDYAVGSRGISMFNCYDHIVEHNSFDKAEINLEQFGCDIGRITTNRFTNGGLYHILDFSSVTLGSQTWIENNDMVTLQSTSGSFIKSCSNHVRIKNNYLEQGTVAGTVMGFIDLSATGMPNYGVPNPPSTLRLSSIVARENRIDGQYKATSFVYRIEATRVHSAEIKDVGTVGNVLVAPWLLLEGEIGLKLRANASNYARYDIAGGQSRLFQGLSVFQTKEFGLSTGVITVDAESLTSLDHTELGRANAADFVRLSDNGIIMLDTLGTNWISMRVPPAEVANPYFVDGQNFRVAVTARAVTAGETLTISRMVGGGVTAAGAANTLTTQFKTFTFDIAGGVDSSAIGWGIRRNALNTDPVYVKSVTITPL